MIRERGNRFRERIMRNQRLVKRDAIPPEPVTLETIRDQEARMESRLVALKWIAGFTLIFPAWAATDKVPKLDVAQSCREAQAIAGEDQNLTYKGCMQDEEEAQKQLALKWSKFKLTDRRNCIAQGAAPLPSYVEILTCLEMYDQASTLYRPPERSTATPVEPAAPPSPPAPPLPEPPSPADTGNAYDLR